MRGVPAETNLGAHYLVTVHADPLAVIASPIMKYLTLLSVVFLPLAFVVEFFGQNFDDLPGSPHWMQSDALMHIMIGLCALTPIVMVAWFRYRDWI